MNIGFDAKRAFHNATGLGHYSRDLIRLLANELPENQYFLFNPKPAKVAFNLQWPYVLEIRPSGPIAKHFGNFWRQYGIQREVKKYQLDVFHGLSAELPPDIEKLGIKTLVTVHDLIFERFPEFYGAVDTSIYRKKTMRAAQIADHVIAVSLQTKMDLINFYKIPEEKISVIYQGCHPIFQTSPNAQQRAAVLAKYDLSENFAFTVGTIEARKNLMTAVAAIKDLPEVQLVAIGKKKAYAQKVQQFVSQNGLSNRVHLLENVPLEDLHVLYHCAKIFLYPSIIEGFGIPLLEAQFSGLPVICSKGGCFAEAGGAHSIYLEAKEVGYWQEAIAQLWHDADKRKEMQLAGAAHIKKFTPAAIAAQLKSFYQNFLADEN